MVLENKDLEMMCVSIPVVDYWEMKEEISNLQDAVCRLERIIEALILLYREERVKNWEMILRKMLEKNEQRRGDRGNRTG